jgi:hypothetical protein
VTAGSVRLPVNTDRLTDRLLKQWLKEDLLLRWPPAAEMRAYMRTRREEAKKAAQAGSAPCAMESIPKKVEGPSEQATKNHAPSEVTAPAPASSPLETLPRSRKRATAVRPLAAKRAHAAIPTSNETRIRCSAFQPVAEPV